MQSIKRRRSSLENLLRLFFYKLSFNNRSCQTAVETAIVKRETAAVRQKLSHLSTIIYHLDSRVV